MAIATTLKSYLEDHHVAYDVVKHDHSATALESAHSAHVPGHQLAKAVVLEDANGYIVSVLPSTNRLDMEWVNESLGRNAYGLDVIWDEQLTNASEIYIEAGDHENLIHMHGDAFCKLMEDLPHNIISTGKDYSRWISD